MSAPDVFARVNPDDMQARLARAEARADREHDLRCDLERRFDHRITDGARAKVRAAALAWVGRDPAAQGNPPLECQQAITALVVLVDSLDAENRRLRGDA